MTSVRPKYVLFGTIGLMLLFVLWNNERFLLDAKAPEWAHLKSRWRGEHLDGDSYAYAVQCARISLGLDTSWIESPDRNFLALVMLSTSVFSK